MKHLRNDFLCCGDVLNYKFSGYSTYKVSLFQLYTDFCKMKQCSFKSNFSTLKMCSIKLHQQKLSIFTNLYYVVLVNDRIYDAVFTYCVFQLTGTLSVTFCAKWTESVIGSTDFDIEKPAKKQNQTVGIHKDSISSNVGIASQLLCMPSVLCRETLGAGLTRCHIRLQRFYD